MVEARQLLADPRFRVWGPWKEQNGKGMRERGDAPDACATPPGTPPAEEEGDSWAYSAEKPRSRPPRSLLDPCVSSNIFILGVSLFLVYCRNFELSIMAFLLFCASMLYHRSRETEWMWLDVALGRMCAVYYVAATATNASWAGTDLILKLCGYFAFAVIAYLTNGPTSLENWTEDYDRLHPLVHILGVIPPAVGGILCKPYFF